mgnify:CR=1 FL=1|jgi:hypothetical protein
MDKLLTQLISTAWGKNLIMWFFAVLVLGCASLCWYCMILANKLEKCNDDHIQAERFFSNERERMFKESITVYQSFLERIASLEKKNKK